MCATEEGARGRALVGSAGWGAALCGVSLCVLCAVLCGSVWLLCCSALCGCVLCAVLCCAAGRVERARVLCVGRVGLCCGAVQAPPEGRGPTARSKRDSALHLLPPSPRSVDHQFLRCALLWTNRIRTKTGSHCALVVDGSRFTDSDESGILGAYPSCQPTLSGPCQEKR